MNEAGEIFLFFNLPDLITFIQKSIFRFKISSRTGYTRRRIGHTCHLWQSAVTWSPTIRWVVMWPEREHHNAVEVAAMATQASFTVVFWQDVGTSSIMVCWLQTSCSALLPLSKYQCLFANCLCVFIVPYFPCFPLFPSALELRFWKGHGRSSLFWGKWTLA